MEWVPDDPGDKATVAAPVGGLKWVPDEGTGAKLPVTLPSELPGRIAGMPGALGGWVKEHPVQTALLAAGPVAGIGSEALGLGEVAAPIARAAFQTAVGAGTGALSGQGAGAGAKAGLEAGVMGEAGAPPLAAIGRGVSGLATAEKAGTQVMRAEQADTLAQQATENELGVSKKEADVLAQPTSVAAPTIVGGQFGPSAATRLAQTKTALAAGRQAAIREIGVKYDPIYGPVEQQPVATTDLTSIGQRASQQEQWLRQRNPAISPKTEKHLQELGQYELTAATSSPVSPSGAVRLTSAQIAQMQRTGAPPAPPTIGYLRGQLGAMMQHANALGTSAQERLAMMNASKPIIKALDDVIPTSQRPLLQEINNQYAQVNRILPFKGLKDMSKASTLPELGAMAFKNDAATSMAVSRMQEPEQQLMRQAFASHILSETNSATEALSKLQKNSKTLAVLYPNSKMGTVEGWRTAMIAQKQFTQGPSFLPLSKEFEDGLKDTIKNSGMTPEALQAASDAMAKTGTLAPGKMIPHGIGRYVFVTAPVMGLMGWGLYHHDPLLLAAALPWYGGMLGWRAVADNPVWLDTYRDFIMQPGTKTSADALGRLIVGGANQALRDSGMPEKQAVGHMKDMSEGTDALNESRAEAVAPTPSASDRAKEVGKNLEKGKTPDVHQDLNRGRLSAEEVKKMLQFASAKDASKIVAGLPLSEVLDAAQVASPEEKEILLPLIKQRLIKELPQEKNKTMQANLAKRYQQLAASANTGGAMGGMEQGSNPSPPQQAGIT